MTPVTVRLRHHVEEEGLDIVVESLVIQEGLGYQTEILTILFVFFTTNFKHGELVFPIDFIAYKNK